MERVGDQIAAPGYARQAGAAAVPARGGWLVSPLFDLAFLVNACWVLAWVPVLLPALLPALSSSDSLPRVEFWQIYFLTTPHRWLTLVLVATDRDRRGGRTWSFIAIAVAAIAVVGVAHVWGVPWLCLLVIDYLWNAWHFGAQHAGLLRIYGKRAGDAASRWETWSLRIAVVYVSVRLAGWSTGWSEDIAAARIVLRLTDAVVIAPLVVLLVRELWRASPQRVGKCAYLASVSLLYGSLLVSLWMGHAVVTVSLAVAASAFHAVEYLGLVTYYAQQRRTQGSGGLFRRMAGQWGVLLVSYMLALGMVGLWIDQRAAELWLSLNLAVAFMHYAYDGMIWKLRQPRTAQALGLNMPEAAVRQMALAGAAGDRFGPAHAHEPAFHGAQR